jgi:hypothetical protein
MDPSVDSADAAAALLDGTFYEITIATVDQPKLLSRLSDAMVGCLLGGGGGRRLRGGMRQGLDASSSSSIGGSSDSAVGTRPAPCLARSARPQPPA